MVRNFLYMYSILNYSESKCIGQLNTHFCKTCDDHNLCTGCAIYCHQGHEVGEIEETLKLKDIEKTSKKLRNTTSCECSHDNPFISSFMTMLKPNGLSKNAEKSKSKDDNPGDAVISISENIK